MPFSAVAGKDSTEPCRVAPVLQARSSFVRMLSLAHVDNAVVNVTQGSLFDGADQQHTPAFAGGLTCARQPLSGFICSPFCKICRATCSLSGSCVRPRRLSICSRRSKKQQWALWQQLLLVEALGALVIKLEGTVHFTPTTEGVRSHRDICHCPGTSHDVAALSPCG